MIVATLVTFYEQNREKISNLSRQQRTCLTHEAHIPILKCVSKAEIAKNS